MTTSEFAVCPAKRTHEQWVHKIRNCHHQAQAKGHDIIYQQLPRHIGITGNRLADDVARETPVVLTPLSRTHAARQIYLLAQNLTHTSWLSPSFQRCHQHELDPSWKLQLPSQISRSNAMLLSSSIGRWKFQVFCGARARYRPRGPRHRAKARAISISSRSLTFVLLAILRCHISKLS